MTAKCCWEFDSQNKIRSNRQLKTHSVKRDSTAWRCSPWGCRPVALGVTAVERSACTGVTDPAGHDDLQAEEDNGIASKPLIQAEVFVGEHCLTQTSKAWGGFSTACKAHIPTSSTCSEAGRIVELSIQVEVGVKGLIKVQDKCDPWWAFAEPFIESCLSGLEHDHHFQNQLWFLWDIVIQCWMAERSLDRDS